MPAVAGFPDRTPGLAPAKHPHHIDGRLRKSSAADYKTDNTNPYA